MTQMEVMQQMYAESEKEKNIAQIETLKSILRVKAIELQTLKGSVSELKLKETILNKEITRVEGEIFQQWSPFLNGVTEAELDMGEVKLTMEQTLNVSKEDEEQVIPWLETNGYEDCLKRQIHTQTLKKIARDLYHHKDGQQLIPGIKYTEFSLIKAVNGKKK